MVPGLTRTRFLLWASCCREQMQQEPSTNFEGSLILVKRLRQPQLIWPY